MKLNNDLVNSGNYNNKWINTGQSFRHIYSSKQNLKDEKVKIKNENRYNLLSDFEP